MKQNLTSVPTISIEPKDIKVYSEDFDIVKEVTDATINTLTSNKLGLAGSIAYLDNGAELYNRFKQRNLPNKDASQSDTARLIQLHKSALTSEIKDIERLIIIGGGAYDSVMNQEMALLSNLYATQKKPALKEIILIDVSEDFLRDGVMAIKSFEQKHKTEFDIRLIRADFKKVARKFDNLMTDNFASKKREDVKAAVIMTGGTFGNIEGISATDRFPGAEIDKQMAFLADFVGNGSTVMFDYFTKVETGANYYNTGELSEFFNNIPKIMQRHCKNLDGLYCNPDPDHQNYFSYRARALPNARMIAHELIAETDQSPRIVNGVERVFPIRRFDTLTLMFSLRAHVPDIEGRPYQNTGLKNSTYVSHGNLVMHSFKRVGTPGATHQPEIEFHSVDRSASERSTSIFARSMGDKVKAVVQGLTFKPAVSQPA